MNISQEHIAKAFLTTRADQVKKGGMERQKMLFRSKNMNLQKDKTEEVVENSDLKEQIENSSQKGES